MINDSFMDIGYPMNNNFVNPQDVRRFSIPQKEKTLRNGRLVENVYNERDFNLYNEEKMSFFSSKDIDETLKSEMTKIYNDQDGSWWRKIISLIPQLKKPAGPCLKQIGLCINKKNPCVDPVYALKKYGLVVPYCTHRKPDPCSNLALCTHRAMHNTDSVILTEDLLVGHFEEVTNPETGEKQDVLHILILWTDGGWVFPGKRDRGYSNNPDVSAKDAMYSLVEKEIGVGRDQIVYHSYLAYFDDRKRDTRLRSNGLISFILLNKRPPLKRGEMISVPINALVQLAKREIKIPKTPHSSSDQTCGMARNHDSLFLSVINTANFYHTMDKVRIAQVNWRVSLRDNPNAKRPSFPDIEEGATCNICFQVSVLPKIICKNKHDLCSLCLLKIQAANNRCPYCREQIDENPELIKKLDTMIKSSYPNEYRLRFKELNRGAPSGWQDHAAFKGTHILYEQRRRFSRQ